MSRYIKADALIGKIKRCLDTEWDGGTSWKRAYSEFIDMIDDIPTADVVERKRGEWIDDGYQGYPCVCSVCGTPQEIKAKFLFSFCPNCGADMRGERKILPKD